MDQNKFNKEQIEAITHENGPLLIIAGAGTGKTTVITERIKYLILEKGVKSSEILSLTFTEKAAREMEDRIDKIMPYGYTQMWIETFHSFCDQILREEAINIGLNPNYKLMTEAESILFLRKNIFDLGLSYYKPLGNPTKFLEALLEHFSRLKDEDISPNEYLNWAQTQNLTLRFRSGQELKTQNFESEIEHKEIEKVKAAKSSSLSNAAKSPKIKLNFLDEEKAEEIEVRKIQELSRAYKQYEGLKIKEGVMDFGDLIANILKLLRERKNILKKYQDQFKYILVDEFQDTNFAQNELAIALAGAKKNITVVADDDQAIYRWRGAALSNVLQFKNNFTGTKIITLTRNYRSTQLILDHAYKLIQNNNPNRLEAIEGINKKLIAQKKIKEKPIELIRTTRLDEEAEKIAEKIAALTKKDYKFSDIAILTRANNHAQPIASVLERFKIPYQFLGPGQLFHQEEIKDLIAYLKVLYNLEDSVSLFRVLNMDVWSISARELNYLLNLCKKKNLTLFEVLNKLDGTFIKDETREKLKNIQQMILKHLEKVKNETAGQILYYFLIDSEFYKILNDIKSQKEEKKAQNIAKFFDRLKTFEIENDDSNVYTTVDWIDLMMQVGESPLASATDWRDYNAVNILTVHSSKGLEFPVVFLINLVTGRFPSPERKEKIPIPADIVKEVLLDVDYHMQEERRLFYVGMTRAKERLYFTSSSFYGEGKRERKVSPFITETLGVEAIKKHEELKEVKQLSLMEIMEDYAEKEKIIQDDIIPVKLDYVSYSQIQAFDICPLHFKARYILNIPVAFNSSLSFGISLHSVLKDFYKIVKSKSTVDENTMIHLLEKNWIKEGYQSKYHEKEAIIKAQEILKNYYKIHFSLKNIPEELELPFSFYIKNSSNRSLKVVGKIDRIDRIENGKLEIIDYKTGTQDPNYKDAYKLQLGIYCLAATRVKHPLFNKKPSDIKLTLFYIETNEKFTYEITEEELKALEQKIFEKVEKIESSDFKCSGHILCHACEYKMLCNTT